MKKSEADREARDVKCDLTDYVDFRYIVGGVTIVAALEDCIIRIKATKDASKAKRFVNVVKVNQVN